MKAPGIRNFLCLPACLFLFSLGFVPGKVFGTEKLTGIQSAQVMSQSMPWIALEAGLFRKYNLDFRLVFISSSAVVTAAVLGGDGEIALTGSVGFVRAFIQGAADLVFIGGVKNILTHSILAGPEIKRPEELKGKKIGVTRIGGNSHYFSVQALRRFGLDSARDVSFIQTSGEFETFAALSSGPKRAYCQFRRRAD